MSFRNLAAAIATAALIAAPLAARAATPADGKLVPGGTVTWSGGPLAGSAPSQRNVTCSPASCDDFKLDIEVPATAFPGHKPLVMLDLTTQANQDIRLLLSKPGTDDSPGQTNYAVYGSKARLVAPQSGVWRVRAACYTCAGATYSVVAKAVPDVGPVLEPRGLFTWTSELLKGPGQGEPGVNVDRHGDIFVNAPAGGVTVWRSFDRGKTWDMNAAVDGISILGSGDSDLAIAPDDDTVYVADLHDTLSDIVYTSGDLGKTYTGPAVAGVASDRPWLAAGTNGVVYNFYHDIVPTNGLWVYRSNDHGKTFTQVGNVNIGSDSTTNVLVCGTGIGHPLVDPHDSDTVYVLYTTGDDPAQCAETLPNASDFPLRQLWMAKSTDGGKSFSQHLIYTSRTSIGHFWPADAIDRDGNVYAVTSETGPKGPGEQALSTHVVLFASHDKAETWSKPIRVDTLADHHSNVFPAIAAGDAGRVVLAWYTSRALTWFDTSATWTVAFAQTQNAFAASPTFQQSRATDVVHEGDVCQSGLFCVFGGNRNLLDFMGIAVAPDGTSVIAYANDLSGAPLDGVAIQTGGATANAPVVTKKPVTSPPKVLGKRTTKRLPATGADAPTLGVMLLITGLALARRARLGS